MRDINRYGKITPGLGCVGVVQENNELHERIDKLRKGLKEIVEIEEAHLKKMDKKQKPFWNYIMDMGVVAAVTLGKDDAS